MQIYKITKGNFALEKTRDIRPHEKYMRDTYFDPLAQFHFKLWNHHLQLLTYSDPVCTTTCNPRKTDPGGQT